MAGRSFFPVPQNGTTPPTQSSFMTLPSQFSVQHSMQQSFIAQNNMMAAHAAVAAASGSVPVSIFRVGANGKQPTPLLASAIPRMADPMAASTANASNTPQDEECEWIEYFNQDGKPYYHNTKTKATTWSKPARFRSGMPSAAIAAQKATNSPQISKRAWKEYKNEEGRSYYHNHETKETTWVKPGDFDDTPPAEKKLKLSPIIDPIPRASAEVMHIQTPAVVDLTSAEPLDFTNLEIPLPDSKSDMEKAMEATLANLPPPEKPKPVETTIDPAELKQQQTDKFKEMLAEKHADGRLKATMTWEQSLRQIQNDSRFKQLTKISEKKRLFNEWKIQQQKDERDARKLALRKAKEDYENFLLNDKRVLPTMSFSKVDRLFGNEDFCKSLGDADKRDIFNDTIGRVRRKREEDAKELRQKCRAVLADLLDSLPDISYRTTWAEAHRVISSCNAFTEHPELKRMHKLEMLEAFGDYIRKAEKHHMDEREQDQKMFRREERKIRDAFHGLMNELQQKGNLLSTSKWTQIYPIIRQDNRFTSMLQQPGSTPLDVFKFYVDDLKNSYNKDRKRVRDIMQKLDFHVTINMPFSEFEEKVRAEDKDNEIDTANLNIYFTSQLDKCAMPNENANVEDDGEIVDELAGETPSKEKKAKKQKKSKKEGKKSKKEKKRKREKEEESISDKEEGEV